MVLLHINHHVFWWRKINFMGILRCVWWKEGGRRKKNLGSNQTKKKKIKVSVLKIDM